MVALMKENTWTVFQSDKKKALRFIRYIFFIMYFFQPFVKRYF